MKQKKIELLKIVVLSKSDIISNQTIIAMILLLLTYSLAIIAFGFLGGNISTDSFPGVFAPEKATHIIIQQIGVLLIVIGIPIISLLKVRIRHNVWQGLLRT